MLPHSKPFGPDVRYLLLDEGSFQENELAPLQNLVAALFRLEMSRGPEDIERVVENLLLWLRLPEQASLRRAFTVWIGRVLLPARVPGTGVQEIEGMQDLQEVKIMLAERVKEWTREWKREARKEGLKEGREEGLKEGATTTLLRQMERKFGPVDEAAKATIRAAGQEQLEEWTDRILTASSLEELLR